jgi:hypothetical protein
MLQLPAQYRAKGLLASFTGLIGFLIASNNGLINLYRIVLPDFTMPDGSYPYPAHFWEVNAVFQSVSVCLVLLGIVAVFFAREEDEFFYKIRLEAIQFAMYTQFAACLVSLAYFYFAPGYQLVNAFTAILAVGLGSFFVAYVLRYYYSVYFQANLN